MRGIYLILAAGLVLLVGTSLFIGAADLWGGDVDAALVVVVSRIPRTCAALLAGAGLALAGVIVQQSVQNRLVDPGLVGTPEAAMLGLLGMTLFFPGAALLVKMSVSAVVALIGTGAFFALSRHIPRRDPMLLPLVGLIYGGILGAIVLWIAWVTDLVQFLGIWQVGEFSGVLQGRYELLWIIGAVAVILYFCADRITILGLGEDYARSLGLSYNQTVILGLALVAVSTSVIVVTVGAMPFVGLVVPNIVSRMWGDNLRQNLGLVAMMGAGFVLASDIIGRVVRWPYEIPAATIFAVVGACLFLWLLNRKPKARHA